MQKSYSQGPWVIQQQCLHMSHCYCRIISEKHSRCNTMLHNLTSEIQTKLILTSQKKYNRTGGPHCSKGFSKTWHSVLSSYSEYFADQILTCDYKCEIWVSNVSKPHISDLDLLFHIGSTSSSESDLVAVKVTSAEGVQCCWCNHG